jgi:hypothetical protein
MPMIISFGWTVGEFRAGRKTVTRRDWPDSHANRFKPGAIVSAYDKQPCWGGVPIGTIEIVSIRRESINELFARPDYANQELRKEGGRWNRVEDFAKLFHNSKYGDPYRIEFRVVSVESAPKRSKTSAGKRSRSAGNAFSERP